MGGGMDNFLNSYGGGILGEWVGDQMSKSGQKADRAAAAIQAENAKAISDAKAAKEAAAGQATEAISSKKRAVARSRSVYTSPLGEADQAATARKTLLGQ